MAKPDKTAKAAVAETLPPPAVIADAEAIARQKRMRFNPIRTLTPERLSRAMDAFDYGDLRDLSIIWQAIADRDDTLASVKVKREKDTAQRGWQVLATDDSAEAQAQKEALEYFYNNVTATNAFDRNERGGFSRLVRRMMEAVSYRYAAHHIVWQPGTDGLTATFEYVPLNFFENRSGELRFVRDGIGITGEPLVDGEWLITVGDGLMISCGIGYVFKRLAMNDLVNYSEKFGFPGVLGRTNAAKGSDAGNAMKAAVESFGNDWSAVIYGDEGSGKIELIEPKGTATNLPMPLILERIDRKMAALYRGADLSTMSSGKPDATGASLQGEEGDILARDDAQMVTEALNHWVDRHVLRWHFGDAPRLAYVQIVVPEEKDLKSEVETITALVNLGAPVAISDALERTGFSMPDEGEPLLTPAVPAMPAPDKEPAANVRASVRAVAAQGSSQKFLRASQLLLGASFAGVISTLSPHLTEALDGPDVLFVSRIRAINARLPQILADKGLAVETVAAFQKIFATAFFNGLTDQ